MQLAYGMYRSAWNEGLINTINHHNATQALVVAIYYIQGKLPGYGGYGGITKLLARTDRGPGEALRFWIGMPSAGYGEIREYYHGY